MKERKIKIFKSVELACQADDEYYLNMTNEQRFEILLSLIIPKERKDAVIERSARVYPIAKSKNS